MVLVVRVALVVRGVNTFAAVLGEGSQIQLRPVKVASTDGVKASLASGISAGDRVAINLPDEVGDGSRIQPLLASR